MAEKKTKATDMEAALEQTFVEKNIKKIGISIVAVVVVVLLCIGWSYYTDSRNQKAAEALYPCEQLFQQGDFEKALNGDGQQVLGFVEVAKQFGSTKSGNLAKLYAGLAYAQTGNMEEAEKMLSDFSGRGDEMVSPAALGALGNVQAELGQLDKAVETLKKAAKKADNSVLSPIYLVQAGEILESQGKADEALKLYEQVRDNYRGSQQGQEIEKYIERIKAAK